MYQHYVEYRNKQESLSSVSSLNSRENRHENNKYRDIMAVLPMALQQAHMWNFTANFGEFRRQFQGSEIHLRVSIDWLDRSERFFPLRTETKSLWFKYTRRFEAQIFLPSIWYCSLGFFFLLRLALLANHHL